MSILALAIILDILILIAFVAVFLKKDKPKKDISSIIEQAQEKSYQLLHAAINKAHTIIEQTSQQQANIISQTISETAKFEEGLKDTIISHTNASQNMVTTSYKQYAEFLENLKKQAEKAQFDNLNTIKQTANQLFMQFETELSNFLIQTRQQSTESIELEIKATRQLIEAYKQQQLKVVDENIVAMLEQTLALVLPRKLTLDDQVDLIYESLEKAKAEKFITWMIYCKPSSLTLIP